MEEDVIPFCLDAEEKNLITIYEQELAEMHDGGNLASASDIVRWLKPVYSRGIYSDFDTNITTKTLDAKIIVEAPILANIGSVKYTFAGLPTNDLESIALNNSNSRV